MTFREMRLEMVSKNRAELIPILRDADEDIDRVRKALDDATCTAYAASVGDQLVGAAVMRWAATEPSELIYLAVAEDRRNQGFGQQIVGALLAELPSYGSSLLVGTANSSLDNIAFYQKCGFRMHEIRRDFFDYVQPPIQEFGIRMRDLVVLRYEV